MKQVFRIFSVFLLMAALCVPLCAAQAPGANQYGTAGTIGEEPRNPDAGDQTNWLTLRAGEAGVRVVSSDGAELLAIDNHGGIYLNGDVYVNHQPLDSTDDSPVDLSGGFLYLLVVVSLILNLYLLSAVKNSRRPE